MSPDAEPDAISALLALLDRSRLAYVVIGGHAVNAWLEPRFTADIVLKLIAVRPKDEIDLLGLVRLAAARGI